MQIGVSCFDTEEQVLAVLDVDSGGGKGGEKGGEKVSFWLHDRGAVK